MSNNIHRLTDLQIKRFKPGSKDQMIADGGGLYLFVRTNGAKEWLLRYTSPDTNKRRKQSLGAYPDIPLQEARNLASDRRNLIYKDIDPLKEITKKREKKRLQRKAILLKQQRIVTLVFDLWLHEELIYNKDKGKEIHRMFKLVCSPSSVINQSTTLPAKTLKQLLIGL